MWANREKANHLHVNFLEENQVYRCSSNKATEVNEENNCSKHLAVSGFLMF
jgi:hypothetical protein